MPTALYNPKTNQVRTFIRDDHGGYRPPEGWELVPVEKLPEGWTREPPTQEEIDGQLQQIKVQCRADILAKFPEWKQANMTARALELLEMQTAGSKWSPAEQAEADAIRAAWQWIKERRAQSDADELAAKRAP